MNSFIRVSMLGALLLAGPAWSEDKKCNNDETITDCVDRLVFQGVEELRTEAVTPEASEANAKATANEVAKDDQAGTSTGAGHASSTFTDLLPWFNALGLLSDSDASDGTVALDLNFLLLQSKKKANHNSQLKWVLDVSPEPYEPLIAALPEDVQEERKKTLQSKIEDTADSEIQYTFSLVNGHFGRDFRPHYGQLSSLIAPVIANASASADNQLRAEAQARFAVGFVRLRSELMAAARGDASGSVDTRTMSTFTPADKAKVEKFVNAQRADLAVAMAKHLDSIAVAIRDPNIDALTNLVLLQPQLTFSLNHQIRNELVGPEATGFKVTFEKSFVDFNAFLKSSAASCAKLERATTSTALSIDEAKTCLEAAGQFVERNAEDLENESRWKASVEYRQVDSWQYALPDDGVAMDRPKYDRVVASAGFGRAVPRSAAKDRVDFEASYDSNIDSDDNYKSRLVATLTYTRRFGDMDIPFSIVYANKSEFLEGVDKQIGLHVGVKFRGVDQDK